MRHRPDISISGIDILVRDVTYVPVSSFDGVNIPHETGNFDVVMFVDTLHHANKPYALLEEAKRVLRDSILLKDHTKKGILAGVALRFMDWVGNAHHAVALPYHYRPSDKWREAFARLDLVVQYWSDRIGLYPWPASWIFDRSLHFIARPGQN
jgi:SAM-dependent methyltransferase